MATTFTPVKAKIISRSQVWCMTVVPDSGRLTREDHKFKPSMSNLMT